MPPARARSPSLGSCLAPRRHDDATTSVVGLPLLLSCAVVAHRGLEKIAGLRLDFQRDPRSGGVTR
ncbi:hypothetical protein GBA52_010969 [Prunus armeniaca]|nr:hypothetical protein GBA52_010969 [Prunus armeniaca]